MFTRDAVFQVWVIDATWTNLPKDVQKEIRDLWTEHEYGNNYYYHTWDSEDEYWQFGDERDGETTYGERFPKLTLYIQERGLEGPIFIHYWW